MILLILILALALRLVNLNQSLWHDEASQALMSLRPIGYILFERGGDFHPPFFYLLSHLWLYIGRDEIWLRILPVIFSVSTIFVVYLLTKKVFNLKIALLSSLLISINPFDIYYAQEFRMYSAASFFTALSFYFFAKDILMKSKGFPYLYVISTTLLLYTHYFGFFVVITQFILLCIYRDSFKKGVLSIVAMGILFLPWLKFFIDQFQKGSTVSSFLPGWESLLGLSFYKAIPLTLTKFLIGRISFDNNYLYTLIIIISIVLILFSLTFSYFKYKSSKVYIVFFTWFISPIILVFLINFVTHIYQPFRLLFILPALMVILSLTYFKLTSKIKNLFLLVLITLQIGGLGIYYTQSKYQREDWRGAISYLNQHAVLGSVVIFSWPDQLPGFEWYNSKLAYKKGINHFPLSDIQIENNLSEVRNSKIVYKFEYLESLSDPKRRVNLYLENNGFKLSDRVDFQGVGFLEIYENFKI